MTITYTDIWKLSIPMHPFRIATGTIHYAQNLFLRLHTSDGIIGMGECSAFPMIVGETQATCFEMAKEFAALWKGKNALDIGSRLSELDLFTAFNSTAKSAFDMALYDISAKHAQLPLYRFLGGHEREMVTDLTIGLDTPESMAATAVEFVSRGATILKVKLGHGADTDISRVQQIRESVGPVIRIRVDANQGWNYAEALQVLHALGRFDVEFCEQPMKYQDDEKLPSLRKLSPVKIMADESVYDHYDAIRIINAKACDYVNIKFAKSGGISEARKIDDVCAANNIPCMMGGMLESRLALTAFAHFAAASENIIYYDMDTCMLGHKADPVTGGLSFDRFNIQLPAAHGIGADIADDFLSGCEHVRI